MPEVSRGKGLWRGDPRVVDTITVAATLVPQTIWAFGIGNPHVSPRGPNYLSCRTVGVSFITIGRLRVWAVVPALLLDPERIRLPTTLSSLSPELTSSRLRWATTRQPDLNEIRVQYPDHDAAAILGQFEAAWLAAKRQEAGTD